MKYLKLFENFRKHKGVVLYHGTTVAHDIEEPHFFSVDENFALFYGHIIYKMELLTNNIFDSTIPDNIRLLYKEGFYLTDDYIIESGADEEDYPTYNFKMDRFDTAEDFINANHFGSDTWEVIEHSHGVMEWIAGNYDGCLILEGGYVNYYIFEPETYCKLLDVYKQEDKNPNNHEEQKIRLETRLKKTMPWE